MKRSLPYRHVIFDLDGTVADTRADLAQSMIRTLNSLDMPEPTPDQVIAAVGWGARNLVARVVGPEHEDRVDEVLGHFRRDYRAHLVVETRLFDGMRRLLQDLSASGARLSVATNKPVVLSRQLLDELSLDLFDDVVGPEDVERPKPAPDMLGELLARSGVEPAAAVMVGDMETDVGCAIAAGVPAILVLWGGYAMAPGLERRADHVCGTMDELRGLLL